MRILRKLLHGHIGQLEKREDDLAPIAVCKNTHRIEDFESWLHRHGVICHTEVVGSTNAILIGPSGVSTIQPSVALVLAARPGASTPPRTVRGRPRTSCVQPRRDARRRVHTLVRSGAVSDIAQPDVDVEYSVGRNEPRDSPFSIGKMWTDANLAVSTGLHADESLLDARDRLAPP